MLKLFLVSNSSEIDEDVIDHINLEIFNSISRDDQAFITKEIDNNGEISIYLNTNLKSPENISKISCYVGLSVGISSSQKKLEKWNT